MKEITVEDCLELQKKFKKYCETAEQYQFALCFMVEQRMNVTIAEVTTAGKVEDQKDARAMFRVVLRLMGEAFSEYEEDK